MVLSSLSQIQNQIMHNKHEENENKISSMGRLHSQVNYICMLKKTEWKQDGCVNFKLN